MFDLFVICAVFLLSSSLAGCRRMRPVWVLVAVVLVGVVRGAVSQCWEHPSCQELSSESSMMVTHCRDTQPHSFSLFPDDQDLIKMLITW